MRLQAYLHRAKETCDRGWERRDGGRGPAVQGEGFGGVAALANGHVGVVGGG